MQLMEANISTLQIKTKLEMNFSQPCSPAMNWEIHCCSQQSCLRDRADQPGNRTALKHRRSTKPINSKRGEKMLSLIAMDKFRSAIIVSLNFRKRKKLLSYFEEHKCARSRKTLTSVTGEHSEIASTGQERSQVNKNPNSA